MGFDPRISQEAHQTFFLSALDRAKAILQSMVEEIHNFWTQNGVESEKF